MSLIGKLRSFCLHDDCKATRYEAASELEAMQAEIERLRAHISEQIIHAETRIDDGKEMGATVWRIALEDIARENRSALDSQGK